MVAISLRAGNTHKLKVANGGALKLAIGRGIPGPPGPGATDAEIAAYVADVTSATRAELDSLYAAAAARGTFYPETYAVGDIAWPNDANAAWQAAIDAAYAAGGGRVVGSQLYGGGAGDITQKNGVVVEGVGTVGPAAPTSGFKAIHADFRYRMGNLTGHPYPGALRDITFDGDNIAGGTTEVLRIEAVETSLYDVHELNSLGNGVDYASSQNVNFFNCNFGSNTEGSAVVLRAKQAGAQPPGHCMFYGGHIGDSKRTIWSTSHDATFFVGPHDNYFIGTIIETGRSAYDIDNVIQLDDGDTHFIGCTETIGAQVTAINDNCAVLIKNDIRPLISTTMTWNGGSYGGGAGAVKADHAVRVKSATGGVSNQVYYSGRIGVANVNYLHCNDTQDCIVGFDGVLVLITAVVDWFTTINGGALLGALQKTRLPKRYESISGMGSPIQVRMSTDTVANRLQIDGLGKISWLDGASGAIRGSLSRVLAASQHFMSMAGIWVFAGGFGRSITTTAIAATQAVSIDAAATSSEALLNFTVNSANVSSLAITNGWHGADLRIDIAAPAATPGTITWPGTGAGGIVPRTTLPQPITGVVQFLDLKFITDRWYEVGRSG